MDLAVRTETYTGLTDRSWLQNVVGIEANVPVMLDVSKFTAGTHYPNGVILAGTVLGKVTSSGLYGPYSGNANEVQTVGLGAASAGSVTLTTRGVTTAAIAFGATAAQIQAALVAAGVPATDVVVTGAFPTLATFTFAGTQVGIDEPAITVTPTGLTGGTVAVVEVTKGGTATTNGLQTAVGLLYDDEQVVFRFPDSTASQIVAPMYRRGFIYRAKLPSASGIDDLAAVQLAAAGITVQ
jgi:hypothetical protein